MFSNQLKFKEREERAKRKCLSGLRQVSKAANAQGSHGIPLRDPVFPKCFFSFPSPLLLHRLDLIRVSLSQSKHFALPGKNSEYLSHALILTNRASCPL